MKGSQVQSIYEGHSFSFVCYTLMWKFSVFNFWFPCRGQKLCLTSCLHVLECITFTKCKNFVLAGWEHSFKYNINAFKSEWWISCQCWSSCKYIFTLPLLLAAKKYTRLHFQGIYAFHISDNCVLQTLVINTWDQGSGRYFLSACCLEVTSFKMIVSYQIRKCAVVFREIYFAFSLHICPCSFRFRFF